MTILTNPQLRYFWCVLTGGILLMSNLPGSSLIYQAVAAYDSNRWVHFLVYATVAVIPVVAWRRRTSVLFSLVIVALGIALELLQTHIPGLIGRPQNAFADMFGVGAGILLGLNIRMMRNSAKSGANATPDPSRTTIL
jgi:uncharacterized membrane protein YedE/YeeE